jgi:hypothetical protein
MTSFTGAVFFNFALPNGREGKNPLDDRKRKLNHKMKK